MESIYKIKNIKSASRLIEYSNLTEFIQDLKGKYSIICWQHQGVYQGQIVDNSIIWTRNTLSVELPRMEVKYWQRARVFNELEEYNIHLRGDKIVGRHRVDKEGEDAKVITSEARLRSIVLDLADTNENGSTLNGIEVNNYLGIDPIGNTRIEDMRFVNFITM